MVVNELMDDEYQADDLFKSPLSALFARNNFEQRNEALMR